MLQAVLSSYFSQNKYQSLALLIFRVAMGLGMMFHGVSKIQNPFGWMGPDTPAILQALAALSEFGGGIAVALGLLTPLAALGILCTMGVAMGMVHIPAGHPFVSNGGPSNEPAAWYFVSALLMIAIGPGKFSLDYLLLNRK